MMSEDLLELSISSRHHHDFISQKSRSPYQERASSSSCAGVHSRGMGLLTSSSCLLVIMAGFEVVNLLRSHGKI